MDGSPFYIWSQIRHGSAESRLSLGHNIEDSVLPQFYCSFDIAFTETVTETTRFIQQRQIDNCEHGKQLFKASNELVFLMVVKHFYHDCLCMLYINVINASLKSSLHPFVKHYKLPCV